MSDTVSAESIRAQMPHGLLTRISGEPNHKQLRNLEKELATNLMAIPCPWGPERKAWNTYLIVATITRNQLAAAIDDVYYTGLDDPTEGLNAVSLCESSLRMFAPPMRRSANPKSKTTWLNSTPPSMWRFLLPPTRANKRSAKHSRWMLGCPSLKQQW